MKTRKTAFNRSKLSKPRKKSQSPFSVPSCQNSYCFHWRLRGLRLLNSAASRWEIPRKTLSEDALMLQISCLFLLWTSSRQRNFTRSGCAGGCPSSSPILRGNINGCPKARFRCCAPPAIAGRNIGSRENLFEHEITERTEGWGWRQSRTVGGRVRFTEG